MRTSAEGIDLIKDFEGLRLKAYRCSAGVLTIGYGHTKGVKPGMWITESQAETWLQEDIKEAESVVLHYITASLTQNQFDALVSLAFNIQKAVMPKHSKLARELNAGNYGAVPAQMARWDKETDPVTGKKVQNAGLARRRAREAELWAREGGTEATGAAVAVPAEPKVKTEAVGAGAVVVGGLGGVILDAVPTLMPLASTDTLRLVLFGIAVLGVAVAAWARMRRDD